MGSPGRIGRWYEAVAEFAGHFLGGFLIFLLLAAAAVGISWIVERLKEGNFDPVIVVGLQAVAYFLFAIDALLFVAVVVTTAWAAYYRIKESLKR